MAVIMNMQIFVNPNYVFYRKHVITSLRGILTKDRKNYREACLVIEKDLIPDVYVETGTVP